MTSLNSENFDTNYPAFLGSEVEPASPDTARFHIIPVPYERTVSYGAGTALGPSAILKASWQLETWDGYSNPSELGIFTREPVDCSVGVERVINEIASVTAEVVQLGKTVVALGGEHTVTYGVIKGLLAAGLKDFGIVQIDAHADLRDRYEGNSLSHACVMKRCVDLGIPLYQIGVRAYCEEERRSRIKYGVHFQDADELVPQCINRIKLPVDFPKNVFFTLDIDGIDPSVFPSTGTPVPGGLGWYQTLALFESICRQRKLIGFDIMEFSPIKGFHAYDFSAALLAYKMMGIVQRA